MSNSIIYQISNDARLFSPLILLFFGFFFQLFWLILPSKFSMHSKLFGYLLWSLTTLLFIQNGIIDSIGFTGHLHQNHDTYWAGLLLIISVFLLIFHLESSKTTHKNEISLLITSVFFGALLLLQSNSYLVWVLGLEILSLGAYSLANFSFDNPSSQSSIKYFLLGAVSTSFMLFGISWIYGFTGSFELRAFNGTTVFHLIAALFISIGLYFKLASFPLHMWIPNIYSNAPEIVLSVFSSLPKIAAGFALIKLHSLFSNIPYFNESIMIFAISSIVIGTAGALVQNRFKTMMGYASIANSGFYLAIPFVENEMILFAFFVFSLSQILASIGAFYFYEQFDFESEHLENWNGHWKKSPLFTTALGICLISLVGLPPFLGFSGKFLSIVGLINGLASQYYVAYVLIGLLILSTLLSLYFYIKPIYHLTIKETDKIISPVRFTWESNVFAWIIIVSLIVIFFTIGELGIYINAAK